MEYSQFYEEYGQPFSGRKLKRLQVFLESMQLSYDQGVEYTVNLIDAQGEIAATGPYSRTSSNVWRWTTAIREKDFPRGWSPC